jgi:Zn-dependent protease
MKPTRSAALVLSLALLGFAAPLLRAAGAYSAGAPVSGKAAGAWGAAVVQSAAAFQSNPALSAGLPALNGALGQLRLELTLRPESQAALAFVAHLPAGVDAKAFAALPEEARLGLLNDAVGAVSAHLHERAGVLLEASSAGELSDAARRELEDVAARWFYLDEKTGDAVRDAAEDAQAQAALRLGNRIASALEQPKDDKPAKVVASELSGVFAGAARLVDRPATLAPYVARALDEADARAQTRGVPAGQIYATLIAGHAQVFGTLADRGLFNTLRARGEWTEFVAAASLHAAERLNAVGGVTHQLLAKAAETDDLRLAIPAWHPLFGRYPSIAHWLAEVHGKPADDSKGKLLFTAAGIPVRADRTMIPALALGAYQFSSIFAHAAAGRLGGPALLLMGLAVTVLLYASVLAHEFGHATAAKAFGIRTRYIVINWLGGGAAVVRGFRQALPESVIAVAGPIVSALCGVFFLAASHVFAGTLLAPILLLAGSMNFLLAAYNLFPFFPMDGARVLRAGLTRLLGSYRATRLTGVISLVLSCLVAGSGMMMVLSGAPGGIMRLLIGLFFAYASKQMGVHPGTVTIDERPSAKR